LHLLIDHYLFSEAAVDPLKQRFTVGRVGLGTADAGEEILRR
jgi:hypothetical protein